MGQTEILPDDWRTVHALALEVADAAGGETVAAFATDLAAENKAESGFDPVTAADRAAEAAMRAVLSQRAPDHGVMGEEFPNTPAQGPWTWTLDPIDGTRAYICGFPTWTTLIGVAHENAPIIGIIDQPVLKDRFVGGPDSALRFHQGQETPLKTRPCARLTEAILAATAPEMFTPAEKGGFDLVSRAAKLTRFGADAYAYAMLAAGRVDLVIEAGLQPYDVRALIPVIRGAGGIITDWRGDPDAVYNGGQVLAAGDPRPHAEALAVLQRVARV